MWAILSFLTAFFESTKDVFSKKVLNNVDEYVVAWSLRFFALPFLLPILFFTEIPKLGDKFLFALIIGGSLNIVATILYMRAIKLSDLSIATPMVTFTPLFLLITSPLIVKEFPSAFGIVGIFLIIVGSYMLNINKKSQGYLAPFKALMEQKGPKLMLLVAFIWSITSNFDKVGIQNSSPTFWLICINIFIAFFMFPIVLYKSRENLKKVKSNLKILVPIGLMGGLTLICQMEAISLTLVAYVIAIKRTSAIISVIFGCLIFKEKGIKERLAGAMVMVAGVLFITLFH